MSKTAASPKKKTAAAKKTATRARAKPRVAKPRAKKPANALKEIEAITAADYVGKSRASKKVIARRSSPTARAAGGRLPPPVPDKDSDEIRAMDPNDPEFKHPHGRKRKRDDKEHKELPWKDSVRKRKQDGANRRRAAVRKSEALAVRVEAETGKHAPAIHGRHDEKLPIRAVDRLIADGDLGIDDWDEEELARGYRRSRNGKFGPPPKYIPREVQVESHRRIVRKHRELIQGAFVKATKQLVRLATKADSEKVRLAAVQEIFARTVGKVPDRISVGVDEPWQDFLADAIRPLSTVQVVDSEIEDGVIVEDDEEPGTPVAAPRLAAAGGKAPRVPGRLKPGVGKDTEVMPAVGEDLFEDDDDEEDFA